MGRVNQKEHQNAISDTWKDCHGQEEMTKLCEQVMHKDHFGIRQVIE